MELGQTPKSIKVLGHGHPSCLGCLTNCVEFAFWQYNVKLEGNIVSLCRRLNNYHVMLPVLPSFRVRPPVDDSRVVYDNEAA